MGFTRLIQIKIKIATALYCFQRNEKRVNNPKEGGKIIGKGLVMKMEGIRNLNIYGTPQEPL